MFGISDNCLFSETKMEVNIIHMLLFMYGRLDLEVGGYTVYITVKVDMMTIKVRRFTDK